MNHTNDNTDERVRREVVILADEEREEHREEGEIEAQEEAEEDDESEEDDEETNAPWLVITTGKILTDGSLPTHRYFIIIAIMCFFSIFLTFMSLNANREYRQREKYATVLH